MVNKPYCIDLYQGNKVFGDNDEGFAQAKASGIIFLDHKASQGSGETDSMCAFRRARWMDGYSRTITDVDGASVTVPPRFGFYHFNGGAAASAEAAHFLSVVKPVFQQGD